jgi:hypothetical protein
MNQPQAYTYCIIGYGIAGQLLTLELLQNGVDPTTICICDETFLGGSLVTQYGTVLSNTPWWKTRNALEVYAKWSTETIQEGDSQYQKDQCMPVKDIALYCIQVANKAAEKVSKHLTTVSKIQKIDETGLWQIQHSFGTLCCKTVFLTQGAESKGLDISHPTIPLHIALDKDQLQRHVTSKDIVTVFGTSHSGTILLQHLDALGIQTNAVHKFEKPFLFSRDGEYSGVKEGSELIADSILQGNYKKLNLIPWSDPLAIHKALLKTTKCIVCIGFQCRPIQGSSTKYDPSTAAIQGSENIYGFGIAYPGTSEINGRTYVDVSVISFQNQIRKCLPAILGKQ